MINCNLTPDATAYDVSDGDSFITTKLAGGYSRSRKDKQSAAAIVSVKWVLDFNSYNLIRAFKASINDGADAFTINLCFEQSSLLQYVALLLPGTWKLAEQRGNAYVVTAQLEITPTGQNPPLIYPSGELADVDKIVALVAGVANFDGSQGQVFELTLTANATSTVANLVVGRSYTFIIIQDGTGGWTFAWPATVLGGGVVNAAANSVSVQKFVCRSDGKLYSIGPMSYPA